MPAPTTYATEVKFADFLIAELGEIASVLSWTGLGERPVAEAVIQTLIVLDAELVADVTDMRKLRAIGAREIWRAAVASLAARYDFSRDQGSYSRSQMLKGAKESLARAELNAMHFDTGEYAAVLDRPSYPHDPYRYVPDELRVP